MSEATMSEAMLDDPYTLLGVARDASHDDINRAFRKLAKELHPDVNPNNKAATERFKRVSAANEFLGDAERRRKFDRGEIDAAGEPRRQYHQPGHGGRRGAGGQGGDDFGLGDIFEGMFGGPRGARARQTQQPQSTPFRGQDVRYTLEVDFVEAVSGAKKRVTLPEGGMLDLNVPEGVEDGSVLRLKGKGAAGLRGGEPGDALVEIKVRQHPEFKRVADDVLSELPVSLDEAVLGAKIEVATVTGRIQLALPKGTSSGRVFRLKGKGCRNMASGRVGDQLITVRIVLPEVIDDSLAYFLSEWRQTHAYDPRAK
jgi:DnaJ-class molecular chaperone